MNEQEMHEIQLRIKQLEELSGTDLKSEMDDLKMTLLKNPSACELLLPEDIGLLVRGIKRIVYVAKTTATKPERIQKKKVDLEALMQGELIDE